MTVLLTQATVKVTLAMCGTGTLPWIRGAFLFPSQMAGGLVGAA
jgi:hypothetical protein